MGEPCVPWPLLHAWFVMNVVFCCWLYNASCARALTRHTPWYMPCAAAVCLLCRRLCCMHDYWNMICSWFHYTCCARAWTRHAPWYMPCTIAMCLVCPYFVACFSVSISWLGRAMHEACGLEHGQCTPRVAWPLLQASPVLDGVAQRRCTHANSAMVWYKIIFFCCKELASNKHARVWGMKGKA